MKVLMTGIQAAQGDDMTLINLILNGIAYFALLIMSLVTIPLFWWLLFINKFERFKIAHKLIVTPWSYIINHWLLHMDFKIIGKEHINRKRKTLYICNHQSWVDITTFIQSSQAVPIAKEEVKLIPFLGIITWYAGTLYFKRENKRERLGIIKEVRELFSKGNHSLCVFPEGSRSNDEALLPPNYAIIKLCYKMNIPVVPAAIYGSLFVLPKGKNYFQTSQKIILKYNTPLFPADYTDSNSFSEACWETVRSSYEELKRDYCIEE